jgi:hypothetical protein
VFDAAGLYVVSWSTPVDNVPRQINDVEHDFSAPSAAGQEGRRAGSIWGMVRLTLDRPIE